MSRESIGRDPKEIIATASLADACRVVISELRAGINATQNALALLNREFRSDTEQSLTDEQWQQFMVMAEEGAKKASTTVNELLVDGLLRRLETIQAEQQPNNE
jgi:hypothetical protein